MPVLQFYFYWSFFSSSTTQTLHVSLGHFATFKELVKSRQLELTLASGAVALVPVVTAARVWAIEVDTDRMITADVWLHSTLIDVNIAVTARPTSVETLRTTGNDVARRVRSASTLSLTVLAPTTLRTCCNIGCDTNNNFPHTLYNPGTNTLQILNWLSQATSTKPLRLVGNVVIFVSHRVCRVSACVICQSVRQTTLLCKSHKHIVNYRWSDGIDFHSMCNIFGKLTVTSLTCAKRLQDSSWNCVLVWSSVRLSSDYFIF